MLSEAYVTVKLKASAGLLAPLSIQRRAGIKAGDVLHFRVSDGIIQIIPKRNPAVGEIEAEDFDAIDAKLDEAEKTPHHGPFDTAEDAIRFLNEEVAKRRANRKVP
jgi:bifunctional DNA-binding transcriptional regulator/antitoxin component of YhaV-PrlF toxin-antitoxin module